MKKLYLYNSKTLKKELFIPIEEKKVKMYVCGPTVYDHCHIGNARPIVVFDCLRRVLEEIGYEVKYVSNYTDVDDKIIKRAIEKNISEQQLTKEMIDAYDKVRTLLNTKKLDAKPKVTETMEDIINFIDELVINGNAYVIDGDVYFRINSIDDYGSLSHQNIEDLKVGARIDENDKKENFLDFVLWKKTQEGIKWETKYSLGRPGWHTECVVMIKKELGDRIDIHAGGKDLRFPHHENERAQAKALFKKDIANYWLHNGMLTFGGEKMSKSLGNLITAKEAIKTHGSNNIRWLLLSCHYRESLPFTDETIENAKKEVNKIENVIKQASLKLNVNNYKDDCMIQEDYENFLEKLCDDLNTPNAYTEILNVVKKLNQSLRNKEKTLQDISMELNTLVKMLDIIGLSYKLVELNEEDKNIYNLWNLSKTNKNFEEADKYRNILIEKGII